MTAGGKRKGSKLSLRLFEIVVALNQTATMIQGMNLKTKHASNQLEAMTVGFTKIVNGKSVTRWNVNRWEVGTFGKNDAINMTETLVELGFDVE